MIKIGNFEIKNGGEPFIIAESGINHNGELDLAFKMIKVAKAAGADAVKFQTFKAEEFVADPTQTYTYLSQGREVTESMLDMFRRYELSKEEWVLIKERCDEEGIMFLSTPQNPSDLDMLLELKIMAIKVGSDDFTNLPLLKIYSKTGLPMIVSSGMSDLAEVYQALDSIGSMDGYPTVLMHCTSQYPTPPKDVNLARLRTLINAFPTVVLGFSDHTQGPLASSLAVTFGASVFEKHFTLNHNLPGPDHWFSEDPEGLKEWVSSIRKASLMIGNELVRPTPLEKEMRTLARRSIVALSDIGKGELLTTGNIGMKRPGKGLPAALYETVLNLKATRSLARGSLLKWGDFE